MNEEKSTCASSTSTSSSWNSIDWNISHDWLLTHILMDKDILRKWLECGVVFNKLLLPTKNGHSPGWYCLSNFGKRYFGWDRIPSVA